MKKFLSLIFLLALFSCGDVVDEFDGKMIDAQRLISGGKCQEALNVLNEMTGFETQARYYLVKASAQACFTSYTTLKFFQNDVALIDASPITDLLPSFSLMSTSDDMTTTTDLDFTGLRDALNTLLFAGGGTVGTYAERAANFSTTQNNDISLFAIYLAVAGLGMYSHFYGNVNTTTGVKGGGAGTSICYFQYTDGTAQAVVDGSAGDTCENPYTGQAVDATLMCEGIVMLNSLFDILPQDDLPLPTDLSSLTTLDTAINTFITTCQGALGAADDPVCTTVSQSECEGLSDLARQYYFAAVFEELHR